MIEDNFWKEAEERFFEVIKEREDDNQPVRRYFLQIKRLRVQYSQRPAIMMVIRNISLIVEFE